MSAKTRDQLTGAALTLLVGLLLSVTIGAWTSKETVAGHNADINRLMDVLCEIKPNARACSTIGRASGEVAQR